MAIFDSLKSVAATIGVLLPLGGMYAAAGLPIPATINQVENRIEPIRGGLTSLEMVVLQQQRETLASRRGFLRNDRFTLLTTKGINKDPNVQRLTESRLAQIDDSLLDIETKDAELVTRIKELQARPWQEKLNPPKK